MDKESDMSLTSGIIFSAGFLIVSSICFAAFAIYLAAKNPDDFYKSREDLHHHKR